MTETDKKLIDSIAHLWIILGGDKDGFEIVHRDIAARIGEIKNNMEGV